MGYLGELMAHLVLDADSQVLGLYPTAALAAAAAPGLPGGVVRVGDVPLVSGAVPGWYVHNNVLQPESPFSAAQTLAMRKQRIVALLRALERIPRIEVWRGADSTGEHRGARADSYGRWVEMQVRAAMVDANYSDVFKYNWMLQEASIPGPTWYWLHKLSDWIAKNTAGRSRNVALLLHHRTPRRDQRDTRHAPRHCPPRSTATRTEQR